MHSNTTRGLPVLGRENAGHFTCGSSGRHVYLSWSVSKLLKFQELLNIDTVCIDTDFASLLSLVWSQRFIRAPCSLGSGSSRGQCMWPGNHHAALCPVLLVCCPASLSRLVLKQSLSLSEDDSVDCAIEQGSPVCLHLYSGKKMCGNFSEYKIHS